MFLIIVALAARSFGIIFFNDHIYYYDAKIDKNGVVELDAKDAANVTDLPQKSRRVTDFALLKSDTTETDLSYF